MKDEVAWVKKWRELERLVDKKYEAHISQVGLTIDQFNEAPLRYFQVHLNILQHSFCIGVGRPRVAAISDAIEAVRKNEELHRFGIAHTSMLVKLSSKKVVAELGIIKACAFPGVAVPVRKHPVSAAMDPLTAQEKRILKKAFSK